MEQIRIAVGPFAKALPTGEQDAIAAAMTLMNALGASMLNRGSHSGSRERVLAT
jgi:hypothetical protein